MTGSILTRKNTSEMLHPEFESIVERIIQAVDKEKLIELRKDFHARLRITLTQPDSSELIEDLWDFFYDWCVFEQDLPTLIGGMPKDVEALWMQVKQGNRRGLYVVQRVRDAGIRLNSPAACASAPAWPARWR